MNKTLPREIPVVYLTPKEAAKYLGVAPATLAAWRKQSERIKLPFYRFGHAERGRIRYSKTDIDFFINNCRVDIHETPQSVAGPVEE